MDEEFYYPHENAIELKEIIEMMELLESAKTSNSLEESTKQEHLVELNKMKSKYEEK